MDLLRFLPLMLEGAWVTAQITALALLLALVMGFTAALMRLSRYRLLRGVATVYVEVFRGTSALVQLFWMFYVLPHFGVNIDPFMVGWVALGLNIGAYGAEVIRGAIQAVPKGQYEATIAVNMTRWQAMYRVIIPQAIPNMIPPWGNLSIELLKATSLVSLITIADLTFRARQLNDRTFETVEIFTLVLLMYLAMALVITAGMRLLEHYTSRGLGRGGI
ncbi:ectoine/hydroxyectoine ABC transporter permease subunit EhuC [Litchfieldella qijiaojingensis]|uniref:Ectoine/hydroxyectoine ABC transporter permease subunit EhuC n=1 Tax=Litchfieldella qijiaojingensis TaxID=980347 RepID=A0ABQ2YLA1_9GAMM|nr:ectoine/hydroxyectoine ABC transporter permease subunit EhuC [Halomonas qijiaojingensis]GGX87508.1 ectoine/hydroxyectoine ABC transporter permease subunit EhuC [Halomonas qijiaojingensis]